MAIYYVDMKGAEAAQFSLTQQMSPKFVKFMKIFSKE